MKFKICLSFFLIIAATATASAAGWYSYSDDPGFTNNALGTCGSDKSPGEYMKQYDELGIPYKKADEKKDGTGQVASLVVIKKPGGGKWQERRLFFREKAACDANYKIAADKENSANKNQKDQVNKKYGDYN